MRWGGERGEVGGGGADRGGVRFGCVGWCAVGDDGDDMMDDVHNPRLRERAKKDGGGVSGGHGAATSTAGHSSRNKRKRLGSQEMQAHARSSPAEDVEETTEDTEMGVSEDDDDPPPPIIIPRRPGKPRPVAKVRAWAMRGMWVDWSGVRRISAWRRFECGD